MVKLQLKGSEQEPDNSEILICRKTGLKICPFSAVFLPFLIICCSFNSLTLMGSVFVAQDNVYLLVSRMSKIRHKKPKCVELV